MTKRALRIFPALIVAVCLTILAGGFLTNLPTGQYATNPETYSYLNNIQLYPRSDGLPGVFTTNYYPGMVNGSLWTLSYEFTLYIAVAILGILKNWQKSPVAKIWVGLLVVNLIMAVLPVYPLKINIFFLNITYFAMYSLLFFSGALAYYYRDRLRPSLLAGLVTFIAFIISLIIFERPAVFGATLLAFSVMSIGLHPFMSRLQKLGDISYGIYIYAFPVQQSVVYITNSSNPLKIFLISFVITITLAILSWYFIEKPALALKKHINPGYYPSYRIPPSRTLNLYC